MIGEHESSQEVAGALVVTTLSLGAITTPPGGGGCTANVKL